MSVIFKPLFDILTGNVAVCNNILYNYLIMLVIGEISFRAAFSLVGDAYDLGIIHGKTSGSILHWVLRFPIYTTIAYILRGGIWLYEAVLSIPGWIWLSVLGCTIGGIVFVVLIKRKISA